ncbi:MAG: hypothetical protein ACOH1T_10190 [Microbacteriaceae bacterium]
MKKSLVTAIALSAAAALALSGCSYLEELTTHEKELSYDTWNDAPTNGDLAFVPAEFISHDAKNLRIRTSTDGTGKLYAYETDSALDPELCAPSVIEGKPTITADWWPAEVPVDGWMCLPEWRVFQSDGVTYSFRP